MRMYVGGGWVYGCVATRVSILCTQMVANKFLEDPREYPTIKLSDVV